MYSNFTIKNVRLPHFSWPTLQYVVKKSAYADAVPM